VARLLKSLGNPQSNSVKYFAMAEILELAKDCAWLAKMTTAVSQHWRRKNMQKSGRSRVMTVEAQSTQLTANRKVEAFDWGH